jgi:hypothetical protein
MISCTDFIPAYSEYFTFLEEHWGKEAVLDFWNHLSDEFLTNLRTSAIEKGLSGCWEYWSKTLNEEAADFTMELDEDAGEFTITMHKCPSKGRLLEESCRIRPYDNYCGHCDVLYRRVLEPLGFEYMIDLSECDHAKCALKLRKRM